jgi:hypothetical protein
MDSDNDDDGCHDCLFLKTELALVKAEVSEFNRQFTPTPIISVVYQLNMIKRLKTVTIESGTQTCDDIPTQTEHNNVAAFGNHTNIADTIKQLAEDNLKESGFVLDPSSGYYYDSNTGYYYDPVSRTSCPHYFYIQT